MLPGAGILMRGLGMRDAARHMKNQRRGREDPRNFDRPRVARHPRDGGFHPIPLDFRGNGNFEYPPWMTDEDVAMIGSRYRDNPRDYSEGLSHNYVKRLFDYERSQWRRQGFTSPYHDDRGRAARYRREFKLWLFWHPQQNILKEKMSEDYIRGYGWPYDRTSSSRTRSQFRHRDIRDPRYRPPCFPYEPGDMEPGMGRYPTDAFAGPRDTRHQRHPNLRPFLGARVPGHPVHPTFGTPGAQFRGSGRDPHPPNRRRTPPWMDEALPDPFIPHHPPPRPHRPPHQHYEYDDDFEDDTPSLLSNESFVRARHQPPQFIYPRQHLRGGRHEAHPADDDRDDFPRWRGGRGGGGRFRGFGAQDLDLGFSADEDDLFD